MKAWIVKGYRSTWIGASEPYQNSCEVIWAQTRNKAKYDGAKALGYEYWEVKAKRYPIGDRS